MYNKSLSSGLKNNEPTRTNTPLDVNVFRNDENTQAKLGVHCVYNCHANQGFIYYMQLEKTCITHEGCCLNQLYYTLF